MASEYLKWKYRDVKPDAPVSLTKGQRAANWWHYHKGWLLAGALLIAALADIGVSALGLGAVRPDYQLAYVAAAPLDDATLTALEAALAALGEDCDGDGRVLVQAHPYVSMTAAQDSDAARYAAAAKVRLMADMEGCESYFFICDDHETLHENYGILADVDGKLAEGQTEPFFIPCKDCPALAELDLSGLYIARRGFWQERTCKYKEQCDALWGRLTEGAR